MGVDSCLRHEIPVLGIEARVGCRLPSMHAAQFKVVSVVAVINWAMT